MSAPSQVIILGASGDLTHRKLMPALARLAAAGRPSEGFSVVGVSRRPKSDEAFRAELLEQMSVEERGLFDKLAPRVFYQAGDIGADADVQALQARLDSLPGGRATGRLFYLSLKPALFPVALSGLARHSLFQMAEHEPQA